MSIDLKQFVDVDIKRHITSEIEASRPVAVLFANTANKTAENSATYDSFSKIEEQYAKSDAVYDYAKIYFNNGGLELYVVENTAALTKALVTALDNKYICIAYASDDANYTAMKSIAESLNADTSIYGINEKIILARTESDNDDSIKNFAVKYSKVKGAEMAIAAYLSKVNCYGVDSIYDYMFTEEKIITAEDIDTDAYKSIISHNMNVDITLANVTRNCGGNCKNGDDLVNNYCRIVLCQTLTDRLVQLLTQKIKSSTGVSKMYAVVAQELDRYLQAGYLTTDKIWPDDWTIDYNGRKYTIIEKGTALINGYVIQIMPVSVKVDNIVHEAPPIYIALADQYGIRKITLEGSIW